MQGRVIFMLEEPSMKIFLEELLRKLFPNWVEKSHFLLIVHQGKSDLDKSIPIKLKAWRYPNDRFVILRDNDNADCIAIKKHILKMCHDANHPDTLVRLVCQELESWYLGDLAALGRAFDQPELNSPKYIKKYAAPDTWQKPSNQISRLVPEFQKIRGARKMGAALSFNTKTKDFPNRSKSFQVFVSGLCGIVHEMNI